MALTPAALPSWKTLKESGVSSAEQLLAAYGVRVPPVDVEGLARAMGVLIHRVPLAQLSGALNSNQREANIYLQRTDHPWRQRFTLAHELGHLMLHPLGQSHRDYNFVGDEKEQQANRFAADLLMPMSMMSIAVRSTGGDVGRLSRLFDVSEPAMRLRLSEFLGQR